MLSYEMLTEIRGRCDSLIAFNELNSSDRIEIFLAQISHIEDIVKKSCGEIIVSLNVDVMCGYYIVKDPSLKDRISKLRDFIRLEISEEFEFLAGSHDDAIIRELSSICPLWLDDFGCGNTNLSYLSEVCFEMVKVDKILLWRYEKAPYAFEYLVNTIGQYCTGVIIEGVNSINNEKICNNINASGKQGFLWSSKENLK